MSVAAAPEARAAILRRREELFHAHAGRIYRQTDRLFIGLLLFQWAAGIFAAAVISPRTWIGSVSQPHLHLWGAVVLGGVIAVPPVVVALRRPGTRLSRQWIALAQAFTSALLIHVSGGRIEAHFHVFGSLAFLAFYRDWRVLVSATSIVALDHLIRGLFWPASVFGVLTAASWRWAEHTGWVLFEVVFLVHACIKSKREMSQMAEQRAELEHTKAGVEAEVERRTAELRGAYHRLEETLEQARAATAERDELEKELHHAQKLEAVGQLAAGIAHEINTPTQFVGDNTRFLREAFEDLAALLEAYGRLSAEARDGGVSAETLAAVAEAAEDADVEYMREEIPRAIEQNLEGVERVSSIVRAMKDFSHPGVEEMTSIDLNRAIRSTATVCRNEWKYDAELDFELDPELGTVACLPGEINQVILNIIVNAAHAIAETRGDDDPLGRITVSTRGQGDFAEIRIADTGVGIPAEVKARIFDPFFTTKGVGKGTGQGLSIAHGVVAKKHNGSIEVESEPGEGTTFIIRLPFEQPSAAEAA